MPVKKLIPTLTVGAVVLSASLAYSQHKDAHEGSITKAICILQPTKGSTVSGTVVFSKEEHGVKVHAHIGGLTPGKHGFHVHEFGDTSDTAAAKSTGGHFNPHKHEHGSPHGEKRHVGDLGNVEADANGNVDYEVVDKHISLHGANSIIGRGLIVHEKADDLKTQPTGDAGGRLAQGVIGVAKGE
jgi:Cu-Zn family superoxide dismutase